MSPFKFNSTCLLDQDFNYLVNGMWRPWDSESHLGAFEQFATNLISLKLPKISRAHNKRLKDEDDLVKVE